MEFNPGQKSANNGAQPAVPRFPSNNGGGMKMGGGDSKKKLIMAVVGLVVVVAVIAAGWWGWQKVFGGAETQVKSGQYQALFLTNGQVYFGKLSSVSDQYVKLTDIYYLQVQQSVQPTDKTSNSQSPQVSLAKLGSELHGPEDQMEVNRDQVLFWENLKNDGKVVQAIQSNQNK
jgi:hypothetical protein